MVGERHLILQEISLRPSGEWTPESNAWTCGRVAAGAGYCLPGWNARELNAGDTFMVGPNSRTIVRASQLGELKLEYFLVLTQYLNGVLTVAEWHQLERVVNTAGQPVLHFAAGDATSQKFMRLAAQAQRDSLATRTALLQLWATAVGGQFQAAVPATPGTKLREEFRRLVSQISEVELAGSPLPVLAEQLHCSERHFSRLFREEFKVSLRSHQTALRLQRASQLLCYSDAKISNVAQQSGYQHLGLFNSMFKKHFGVTPSAWRQKKGMPDGNPFLSPNCHPTATGVSVGAD